MRVNLLSLQMTIFIFLIVISDESVAINSTISDTAQNKDQLNAIKKLQDEVEKLKKQFIILNKNQQAIAQKSGLIDKPEQPVVEVGGSAVIGRTNAKVVLIEFTDLHCPYCKKFHIETFPKINEKFIKTGNLLFVGKHLPITTLHSNALIASQVLECIRGEEEKADQFYSKAKHWLFDKGPHINKSSINKLIQKMGLNESKFEVCMQSPVIKDSILRDINLAKSIGLQSTPSFLIGLHQDGKINNWKTFVGAKSMKNFTEAINKYLTLANGKSN